MHARLVSLVEGKWDETVIEVNAENNSWDFVQGRIYGPLFEKQAVSVFSAEEALLASGASLVATDTLKELKIVLEVKDQLSGEIVHWQAAEMSPIPLLPGDTLHLVTSLRMGRDVEVRPEQIIRTYLWNPTGSSFRLLKHEVYSRGINPKLFCLFEAF